MKILTTLKRIGAFVFMLLVGGCVRIPNGIEPITNFDISRYLGTWYEIARLDHSFERGLIQVTAEYTLGENGLIRVLNRGYDPEKEKWKEAEGRAYFVGAEDVGKLKVSFFGPFYGGYNIIALDQKDYSYALVCGPSRDYLWILARTPALEKNVLDDLVNSAKNLGFPTESLIIVSHAQEKS